MARALSPTILALSLLCANGARAESCYGLEFPETGNLQVGEVVGRGPAPLHRETPPECKPDQPDCVWTTLLPGDLFAIAKSADGYVCGQAAVMRGKRQAFGWIDAYRVKITANAGGRPLAWWAGSWRTPGKRIDLWTDKGILRAEAGVEWSGPVSPQFGQFKGVMTVGPDGIAYSEEAGGCEVKLAAFGEQIVAIDNQKCGDTNANFMGFYTRHRLGEK